MGCLGLFCFISSKQSSLCVVLETLGFSPCKYIYIYNITIIINGVIASGRRWWEAGCPLPRGAWAGCSSCRERARLGFPEALERYFKATEETLREADPLMSFY